MIASFRKTMGNPHEFLLEMPKLVRLFSSLSGQNQLDIPAIRKFNEDRNFNLTSDRDAFRAVLAAFATILRDQHDQTLRVRGVFRKSVFIESSGFSAEFLELYYRCIFEGLDLDEETKTTTI